MMVAIDACPLAVSTRRSSNDRLNGGDGNDILDGQSGVDTAFFFGRSNDFSMGRNPDGSVPETDLRSVSSEGIDALRNVEALEFQSDPDAAGGSSTTLKQLLCQP